MSAPELIRCDLCGVQIMESWLHGPGLCDIYAEELAPENVVELVSRNGQGKGPAKSSSWLPINLEPILDGELPDDRPKILTRTDSEALLCPGRVHVIAGEPESGKGWLALRAVVDELAADRHTLYLDWETTEREIVGRLLALGVEPSRIVEFFHYVRPDEPLGSIDPAAIVPRVTLAVVDGTTEALATFGLKLESNTDQALFLKALGRPLADAGAAVVFIDHATKDKDRRGRWAIGSQHKLAGTDVTYMVDMRTPFGRGLSGLSRLTVSKDRPGWVRSVSANGRHAGEMRLVSDAETGAVTVEIDPGVEAAEFRPTVYMERVSRFLERQPEPVSRNTIEEGVMGKRDYIRQALSSLLGERYATASDGPRRAVLYASTQPYRETDEGSEDDE